MPSATSVLLLLLLAERAAPLRLDALARSPSAAAATAWSRPPNGGRCGRYGRCRPLTMLDEGWDSSYLSELQERISSTTAAAEEAALIGPAEEVLQHLNSAWVLIFNAGECDEGVYTLQGKNGPSHAFVLAFEQTDEALRFAELLQAEGFDQPQPMEWSSELLTHFCAQSLYEVGIVPTGALLTPPTENMYDRRAFEMLEQVAEGGGGAREVGSAEEKLAAMRMQLDKIFDDDSTEGKA